MVAGMVSTVSTSGAEKPFFEEQLFFKNASSDEQTPSAVHDSSAEVESDAFVYGRNAAKYL